MKATINKKVNGKIVNIVNPIAKMIEDKKRIQQALKENKPLSTLKGITFVKPL